ncbi:hypothetical protein POM88_046411 [Heracleum sosnowskyi]|uniref:Uncharacterized protein n=1 Tax=Heracleum sosnowskyi TaxID=360622 RepID=A0AAD8M752_9APIA|nr:hypothetical protein POM88_046411 [Heracleum sosnowskyi]
MKRHLRAVFTGRCGKPKCCECHAQPACKSKDKAKGSQKLKSTTDVSTDCRYMSWQLVDQTTNETKKSFDYSATAILDRLANDSDDYLDYDDDDNEVEYEEDVVINSDAEMIFSDVAKTIIGIMDNQEDWFFAEHQYMLL